MCLVVAVSERYYDQDIMSPMIPLKGTYVEVPDKSGMGYEINWRTLNQFSIQTKTVEVPVTAQEPTTIGR